MAIIATYKTDAYSQREIWGCSPNERRLGLLFARIRILGSGPDPIFLRDMVGIMRFAQSDDP